MSASSFSPGSTIGILGGGQLARMLCMEAKRMGYKTLVWSGGLEAPASALCDQVIELPLDDLNALQQFNELADVATGEFQWMHHIAIGAEGQPTMGQLQAGGVVEHPVWIVIEPVDFALNQLLHQGAATAMAKQNPFDAIGGPAQGL